MTAVRFQQHETAPPKDARLTTPARAATVPAMGPLKYFRERRRRRAIAERPISAETWEAAVAGLPALARLDARESSRLKDLSAAFLDEKSFLPLQGAALGSATAARIAALACLPVLELDLDWYADWKTIIVVPDAYEITRSETDEAGVVHEYQDELGGEVLHLGPVVLSLADVAGCEYGDGYNVVIHEAAHKIDGRDGTFDGCPPLPADIPAEEWTEAFSSAYARLRAPRRRRARRPRIDEYAGFSPDEFFAVCTESFFETPIALKGDFPAVYQLLARFFRQDPYARFRS